MAAYHPPRPLLSTPFAGYHLPANFLLPRPSPDAFGKSGAVQVRVALPGERVTYPIEVGGDPTGVAYGWVRLIDSVAVDSTRPLVSDTVQAPSQPGLYRLALVEGALRHVLDTLTLVVLVPFEEKRGSLLDGYRIGIFPGERSPRRSGNWPAGFVRVYPETAELAVSKHLRLGDFITRDGQTTWPRYVALSPRLLDKVELVAARIARTRRDTSQFQLHIDVQSAFRTPFYNRLNRFARESRHQFGDAMDLAIDADGDGRLTLRDARIVTDAVEAVERDHPDLVGGLGLYTSRKYSHPYVHIDARGSRVRWRG